MKHSSNTLVALITSLCFSAAALAEGLADRRHDNFPPTHTASMIDHIHAQHGPTHSGPMEGATSKMETHHQGADMMTKPKYSDQRSKQQYRGLSASEYKRLSVGSN